MRFPWAKARDNHVTPEEPPAPAIFYAHPPLGDGKFGRETTCLINGGLTTEQIDVIGKVEEDSPDELGQIAVMLAGAVVLPLMAALAMAGFLNWLQAMYLALPFIPVGAWLGWWAGGLAITPDRRRWRTRRQEAWAGAEHLVLPWSDQEWARRDGLYAAVTELERSGPGAAPLRRAASAWAKALVEFRQLPESDSPEARAIDLVDTGSNNPTILSLAQQARPAIKLKKSAEKRLFNAELAFIRAAEEQKIVREAIGALEPSFRY